MEIMRSKISRTSALQIAEVLVGPGEGRLGLTLCPGKKDSHGNWDRDLREDLDAIRAWGATAVVTLIEDHEFRLLAIENLGSAVWQRGMDWLHLPIRDVDIPDAGFEQAWKTASVRLHRRLDAGERILIHCRGGIGRTGLVAGLILVERGFQPRDAINRIRAVRPGAIETRAQEEYVLNAISRDRETLSRDTPELGG